MPRDMIPAYSILQRNTAGVAAKKKDCHHAKYTENVRKKDCHFACLVCEYTEDVRAAKCKVAPAKDHFTCLAHEIQRV